MAQTSAGLLVFRRIGGAPEFLLAHPGGPFWRNKDGGAWSIPKGLIEEGEEPLAAAVREFEEEIGVRPVGPFEPLAPIVQKAGKRVLSWLVEADLDLSATRSNLLEMEWPRGSGRRLSFPEVDKVGYFPPPEALEKVLASQRPLLLEAFTRLDVAGPFTEFE